MRRKPLPLMLMALVLFSSLLVGCRRPVVPPVDTLVPEDEATAAMQEAESNTEGMQESPEATPVSPAETPTEEPPPPSETVADPTATTEPAPTDASPPDTAAPTPIPTTAVSGQLGTHVVKPGENMFRIALRYDTTVAAISQANNITNPNMISVGQELKIPAGAAGTTTPPPAPSGQSCTTTYVVKPGDNLFRIALRHNYSQYYLAQANGISNPALIRVGQVICIP
jgi:LysM repeat protein